MLYNNDWNEEIQNYAVDLLYAIKKAFPNEWQSSWKFEAFLGNACNIALRYNERYEAYMRASQMIQPMPPSLMVLLAGCYIAPGIPPISQEEAEDLLKSVKTRKFY